MIEEGRRILRSSNRSSFLGNLAAEVGVAARSSYVRAGNSMQDSSKLLECLNELMIVIIKQMRADSGVEGIGYPDDALMGVLLEKAAGRACEEGFRYAVERAIARAGSA